MKLWYDFKNSHEPAFFKPFLKKFSDYQSFVTLRDYAEVIKLADFFGIKGRIVGKHYGGNYVKKASGLFFRDILLYINANRFDVSISFNNVYCTHVTKMKRKKGISFTDNEKSVFANKLFFRFIDYLITPSAIPKDKLIRQGARNIVQFEGFKEDVYIANFKPDQNFLDNLPFKKFVTIRPEAFQASYVGMKESIVPKLVKRFNKENINVLFLPRYVDDRNYVKGANVFIPKEPLNGLDVCYYSKVVLTGSGTFARESACMGTPAVSFYPDVLLSVDKKLVDEGKIFHSRNVDKIVDYVIKSKKKSLNLERCKKVQEEVLNITKNILEEIKGDIY
ncbi:MAG: DUF354 domain-containing protein [Thermoplasmatales archaeon]|nr:DUF354 domain-containing protein [Thermoplasmatales archaeon]